MSKQQENVIYLNAAYPTAVYCIIATEFCERFSFCGLRTILSLYLRNILFFSENSATLIYHVFIMVCYLMPLIGAICADSYFGRYRTIRNFLLIYLLGSILLCLAAIPVLHQNPVIMSALGLLLVSIGSGGLKPCVAAFGAEQFHLPEQGELLRYFFSIFYFTINLGGFVGMILTPVLRKVVRCFGDDSCYALGYGFPAVLVAASIILFMMGKSFYKMKKPKRNIVLEFFQCSSYALSRKCERSNKARREHWLDHSKGHFDGDLIRDMKTVCAILFLFVPLPIFWSLFDQQGSRWTFQASHMDGNVFGIQILPDQIQVINPAMVLFLIPIFDKLLYPCCEKLDLMQNALHRMAVGGLVAGLAFISAGVLELVLETSYPDFPEKYHGSINIINTLPCDVTVNNPTAGMHIIESTKMFRFGNLKCHNRSSLSLTIQAPPDCEDVRLVNNVLHFPATLHETQEYSLVLGIDDNNELRGYVTDPLDFQKSMNGAPKLRINFVFNSNSLHNASVALRSPNGLQDVYFIGERKEASDVVVSPYIELSQGVYECEISSENKRHLFEKSFHFALGGVYSLVIRENVETIKFVKLYTLTEPNSVNILWQLPQYFLISVAEIMFGVAGLEFSFTQAPKSMKTVTIAGWYLSTAVGNLFVIIITQLNPFSSQAHEFFLFATLIVAVMVVFAELASHYRFVQLDVESSVFILEPVRAQLADLE